MTEVGKEAADSGRAKGENLSTEHQGGGGGTAHTAFWELEEIS